MTSRHDELVFAPLGGVGEIGMNLALYGLGSNGRREWLCVDMGVAFADAEVPGIDLIILLRLLIDTEVIITRKSI